MLVPCAAQARWFLADFVWVICKVLCVSRGAVCLLSDLRCLLLYVCMSVVLSVLLMTQPFTII